MQQGNLVWGVPDVSSNSLVITYHSVSAGTRQLKHAFPPLLFSFLHYLDSHRERDLLYSTLRHGCFRVKIQMSGSEHYPPLSNFYRRLAVQFCSSAELNPKKHSGKWGCRFSPVECAVIISASCLKVIRPRWGKDPNQACDAAPVYECIM